MTADGMRTQDQNPAYRKFGHILPPSGLYPARWVDIFSNMNDRDKYDDIEVVFVPRDAEDVALDGIFWDEFGEYNGRWLGDLGNSVAGWMEPGGLNPEKVFGGMLAYGFSSRQALADAIAEFASIEECEWARHMKTGGLPGMLDAFAQGREEATRMLRTVADRSWAKDILDALKSEEGF